MERIRQMIRNIFHLGVKELLGLWRDPLMMILIVYSFSIGIYVGAKAQPDSLTKAAIAVVDEDHSPLSERLTDSFLPPMFLKPAEISRQGLRSLQIRICSFFQIFRTRHLSCIKSASSLHRLA